MAEPLLFAGVVVLALIAGALGVALTRLGTGDLLRITVAFGAGYLISVAFLGMVPHALEREMGAAGWILGGYLLLYAVEHAFGPQAHAGFGHREDVGRWVGLTVLAAISLHILFDGVAIASGFERGASLGTLILGGIVIHKVPEGLTVASILISSGFTRRQAVAAVGCLGLAAILGVLLTGWIQPIHRYGLALSAGATLYIAASHLIPEVRAHGRLAAVGALLGGVAVYLVAALLLGDLH